MPDEPPSTGATPLFAGARELGPLRDLPGTWEGTGFRLSARAGPNHHGPPLLALNATREAVAFAEIALSSREAAPTRRQADLHGVHYVREVSDSVSHAALHSEAGIWVHVPARTDSPADPSVVLWARTPDGETLLAQGTFHTAQGGPQINPISATTIDDASKHPITDPDYQPDATTAIPPGIPAAAIENPNAVLEAQIEGQAITSTTTLSMATTSNSHNAFQTVPFAVDETQILPLDAVFWIERVADGPRASPQLLQLQYSQKVTRVINGIQWPEISVATLVKRQPEARR